MLKVLVVGVLAVFAALGSTHASEARVETATVEVRVWQSTTNPGLHYISARPSGGSWRTLGTIWLPLNSATADGRYRYGGIALDVPHSDRDPATVEVRVWKATWGEHGTYIGARLPAGSWADLGMIALPLDGRVGRWRYGDIHLTVNIPSSLPRVASVQFFGDFTEDQRARYEEALRVELESAARFYRDRYGVVTPDLEFHLTTRDVPEDHGFAYGGGIIYLRQHRIEPRVQEVPGGTIMWSAAEFGFLGPLAHEYVHALQDTVGSFGGPLWLQEGMAWYLDALHDRTREEPDRFKSRDYLLWEARGSTVTLPMMEGRAWHWGVGYLATEQLIERSSEDALFDFYRNLGTHHDSWQEVFANTFGLTVDAFYEDVALWRAREAPPQAFFSGVIVGPDGNPVDGVMVAALRAPSDARQRGDRLSSSWIERSRDDGTFDVRALPSAETVIYLLTDECNQIGLLAEDGGLTLNGAEARRFAIELEGVSGITITLPTTRENLCAARVPSGWYARGALGWR